MENVGDLDLVVVGGGMAGICGAIAAARLGCRVALVHDRPVLGGNSSSECRVWICGADHHGRTPDARETGILEELRAENQRRNPQESPWMWDAILWDAVTREPGLRLFLNARCYDAEMEKPGMIHAALAMQIGNEKRLRFEAPLFMDASGDGEFAFRAGADYRAGREARSEFNEDMAPEQPDAFTLGSSLLFTVKDMGRAVKFDPPAWARKFESDDDLPFRGHHTFQHPCNFWWIEWGGERDTVRDNEEIRDELLRILFGMWDHIKNHGDHKAENLALDWIGFVPAKRENRRFMGDHILTQGDIENQVLFEDRVSYGGWPIDLHPPKGIYHPGKPAEMKQVGLWSIPLRSLYSRNVENLFLGGRLISGTHVAHGSYRVMATGAAAGQSAGTAAAFCRKYGRTPREIGQHHISEIQQQLLRDDCYVIDLPNADSDDLARNATVAASSTDPSDGISPPAVINGVARGTHGNPNQWRSDPKQRMPQWIELDLGRESEIGLVQIAFDTALGRLWGTEPHPETVRDYSLLADGRQIVTASGNNQRLRRHAFEGVRARCLRIQVSATNGDPCARIFEVRVYR